LRAHHPHFWLRTVVEDLEGKTDIRIGADCCFVFELHLYKVVRFFAGLNLQTNLAPDGLHYLLYLQLVCSKIKNKARQKKHETRFGLEFLRPCGGHLSNLSKKDDR